MRRVLKKGVSIGVSIVLLAGLAGCTAQTKENFTPVSNEATKASEEMIIWYTNEELSTYIEAASNEYGAAHNITVIPKLVSEIDYIENINQAVLSDEAAPDLFIAQNCDLEKLYLAGLTTKNQDTLYTEENYYKTALDAFTYKDKLLAYPLYFETSYLLYNQSYVTTPPTTIDEILNFANEFDAPEGVESIFNWDVTDVLCNYFFIGNYLNLDGNSPENYFTDKEKALEAFAYYQNLNQYFAIDADKVDYEEAFQSFIDGKSVFTIAKTDKLPELEIAQGETKTESQSSMDASTLSASYAAGMEKVFTQKYDGITNDTVAPNTSEQSGDVVSVSDLNSNFKIAPLPNLTSDLVSKGISVSFGVFVNGYTAKSEEAEKFAKYLSYDDATALYKESGKLSTRNGINYKNDNISTVLNEYAKDAAAPKGMEEGDFWLQLEIAFSNIWKGADVTQAVEELIK